MNKNLHRIIFSQARGQRMVVQETAASTGKANGATKGQRPGGLDGAASTGHARLGRLAFAVLCLAGTPLHLMSAAQAQIVADPSAPGNQRPTVLQTANGVPQVNIQTPSAAGVSRNTYRQFDVQRNGAILNNSRTHAPTQLGGWVQGNPWLAGGPARVIFNEVNSVNPSQLKGYVEVAGSRAEVIIANPAGISVDGGGFLNASRVTLTTGTPVINGGSLDAYRVQSGAVTINGAGLDASQTDYTSILARAVQVNAPVWANELKVTTGANQISADQAQVAPIAGAGPAPVFALDVAQLGGMYAGKIHLISTQAGVGVRNSGQLSAGTGQLTLSADGWLRNSGTVNGATGVTISASAGIDNSGTVYSQGDASLATRGDVANSGVIAAQGNVTASALGANSQVSSTTGSIWAAGLRPDGSVSASGNLSVQATQNLALHGRSVSGGDQSHAAAHLDLSGSQLSARDLSLTATTGDVNASNASLAADQTLTATARQNLRTDGARVSGKQLNFSAQSLSNAGGEIVQTGLGDMAINLVGDLNNSQGAIRADQSVQIVGTGSLNNTQGLVSSGHTVDVRDSHAASNPAAKTQSITNTQGTLIAGQALNIDSGSLSGDGRVLSQGDLSVTLNGDFTHTGELTANGTASLNIRGDLTNQAKLLAGNTINVTAANVNNTATGEIRAANTKVTATGTLTNRGLIDGTQTRLKATTVNNIGTGRIFGTELAIAATTLNNDAENGQAAVIAARLRSSRLDIGAQTINNREGALLFSAGDMAIGGSLDASWRATGQAQTVNNNSATIEALGGLSLATGQLSNTNGHFSYTVVPSGSVGKTDYITPNGVYGGADVAWLGAERLEVSFFGGPPVTYFGREKIVPRSSPYANPRFKAYYEGPPAYKAPYSYETGGGDAPQTVNVAAAYHYTADSPIWADFGVAAPTQSYVTAPQPWADLQAKLNVFYAQVTASLVGYDVYRSYTETSYTATTLTSKPGQILSGGAMTLSASDALVNDKSKIIAGGALSVTGRSIDNRTASVSAPSQRSGTAYSWGVIGQDCDWAFGCDDIYGWQTSAYAQEIPKTVTLALAQSLGNTAPPRVGASVPASPLAPGIGQSAVGAGSPGVQLGQAQSVGTITQIAAINRNNPGALPSIIRTTVPNTALPGNSLFRVNPAPSSRYLVETDPRFASYQSWLSSDYMLSALRVDPTSLQKRLGDGFYEQRLINEQVAQLTGQRFLQGFASDEAQYRALIDSGVTVAQQWSLRPGIALSAEQMAQLTSDIVWLVEREVSLADGSIQKVLVPQVYVAVKPGDLKSDGSLLAGQSVKLNLSGDLTNSGTIAGRSIVALNADNVHNLAGRIQGQDVTVAARSDLNNIGGVIQADKRLVATAGRDLNVVSTTQSARSSAGAGIYDYTGLDRIAGLYVTAPAGTLVASAGRDLNLIAANVQSTGSALFEAGRDLTLGTVRQGEQNNVTWDERNYLRFAQSQEVGTKLAATGNITLQAGNNLSATAASVNSSSGALVAQAGRDVSIQSGSASQSLATASYAEGSGFLSSASTELRKSDAFTQAVGSSFGGNTVTVVAGKDINVKGSAVNSDVGTTLAAGNNLSIEAAQNTQASSSFKETKSSGLSLGDGMSVSYGKQQQSLEQQNQSTTAAASTIGSIAGNVTLVAGNQYRQVGSDVLAPGGDITIVAKKVDIAEARETSRTDIEQKPDHRKPAGQEHVSRPRLVSWSHSSNRRTARER